MDGIRIEKGGDVHRTYAHLEAFQVAATNPFLEISITEERALRLPLFSLVEEVTLPRDEWEQILVVAHDFIPKAVANEGAFEKWSWEQDQEDDGDIIP